MTVDDAQRFKNKMPLYILYHDVDALTIEEKQKVAKGITNAHVQATGIAPFLVKVVLHSSAIGELYTGGEIDRKTLRLVGNVRKRTDVERKRELFRCSLCFLGLFQSF